jgi:hypothetical protein
MLLPCARELSSRRPDLRCLATAACARAPALASQSLVRRLDRGDDSQKRNKIQTLPETESTPCAVSVCTALSGHPRFSRNLGYIRPFTCIRMQSSTPKRRSQGPAFASVSSSSLCAEKHHHGPQSQGKSLFPLAQGKLCPPGFQPLEAVRPRTSATGSRREASAMPPEKGKATPPAIVRSARLPSLHSACGVAFVRTRRLHRKAE